MWRRRNEAAETLEQALERYERKKNLAMVAQVRSRLEGLRCGGRRRECIKRYQALMSRRSGRGSPTRIRHDGSGSLHHLAGG
jgi:hypothetical protein